VHIPTVCITMTRCTKEEERKICYLENANRKFQSYTFENRPLGNSIRETWLCKNADIELINVDII
jgi:hypothetical protein